MTVASSPVVPPSLPPETYTRPESGLTETHSTPSSRCPGPSSSKGDQTSNRDMLTRPGRILCLSLSRPLASLDPCNRHPDHDPSVGRALTASWQQATMSCPNRGKEGFR